MRNLIVTENITLDGVLDGDFFVRAGETADAQDIDDALREQRERADALVLGRNTFEAFRDLDEVRSLKDVRGGRVDACGTRGGEDQGTD